MEDHFYMTLPSSSSKDHYPRNSPSRFTTKLNKPIQLAGEWSMGLAEIAYPQSWYNVRGSDDLRWSVYNKGGTEVITEAQDYFLPAGIYTGTPG